MKKSLEIDAVDLSDIMESFITKLPSLSEPDMIDLAARLKPVAKACKTIDDHVKEHVKDKLKHKEGTRLGGLFKAILSLVPTSRLDQKALKEQRPRIHAEFNMDVVDERVTFELR